MYGGTKVLAEKLPGQKQSYPLKNATIMQKQMPKYARKGCSGAFQGSEEREILLYFNP